MNNEIVTFLVSNAAPLVETALAIIGVFALIANFTKTEADNRAVAFLGKVVAFLAANIRVDSLKK